MQKKTNLLVAVSIIVLFFIASCAGGRYGSLGHQTGENGRVTVADLETGWQDYDVHYNTWTSAAPAAMMFDPKNNATTLAGSSWTRVEEQAVFTELLEQVTRSRTRTRVLAIFGPGKQLLGYMLTPTTNIFIKAVDETTFSVSTLRRPPDAP